MRCWLEHLEGSQYLVGRGGVLLGRHRSCDVVIDDTRVSRLQALVRLGPDGPELVQIGRNEVQVNGADPGKLATLQDGDVLTLPSAAQLRVRVQTTAAEADGFWLVRTPAGGLYGLNHFPFSVGGGPDDTLQMDGWPAGAVVFRSAQGSISVEGATPLVLGRHPLAPGEMGPVRPGMAIESDFGTLEVRMESGEGQPATLAMDQPPAIESIVLAFMPTGGRIEVAFPTETLSAYLPERRFALLVTLLSSRSGQVPGDVVDDEHICAQVWPREPEKGRVDVNVLIQRARKDLIKAGLDGFRLLERVSGGTRFAVPKGVPVQVD